MEGQIVALAFTPKGAFAADGRVIPFDCDCAVEWDGESGSFAQNTAQLEPILPSGHRASTESFQELMDRLNTEKVERVEEVGA
ncbi:hypothetical protein M8R20_46235 [Pseudomonas sp. R2.Fl]|nr:hypothetical protein [Pseudomonas sp. R2.Fl]MCL6714391.1 hypothetical protein [Pseudomonas sp. R2.Fl]